MLGYSGKLLASFPFQHGNGMYCITFFFLEIIEYLLEHKSTVKERNLLGWTPLNEAISRGNREISELQYDK